MKSIIARLTCLPFMLTAQASQTRDHPFVAMSGGQQKSTTTQNRRLAAQCRSSVSNRLNLSTRCAEVRPDRDHDGL